MKRLVEFPLIHYMLDLEPVDAPLGPPYQRLTDAIEERLGNDYDLAASFICFRNELISIRIGLELQALRPRRGPLPTMKVVIRVRDRDLGAAKLLDPAHSGQELGRSVRVVGVQDQASGGIVPNVILPRFVGADSFLAEAIHQDYLLVNKNSRQHTRGSEEAVESWFSLEPHLQRQNLDAGAQYLQQYVVDQGFQAARATFVECPLPDGHPHAWTQEQSPNCSADGLGAASADDPQGAAGHSASSDAPCPTLLVSYKAPVAALWNLLQPLKEWPADDGSLEALAMREHDRYCDYESEHGSERRVQRASPPRRWSELSDGDVHRDMTFDQIRRLPLVLAKCGYLIYRRSTQVSGNHLQKDTDS